LVAQCSESQLIVLSLIVHRELKWSWHDAGTNVHVAILPLPASVWTVLIVHHACGFWIQLWSCNTKQPVATAMYDTILCLFLQTCSVVSVVASDGICTSHLWNTGFQNSWNQYHECLECWVWSDASCKVWHLSLFLPFWREDSIILYSCMPDII